MYAPTYQKQLDEYVAAVVEKAPPLTDGQRHTIGALVNGGRPEPHRAQPPRPPTAEEQLAAERAERRDLGARRLDALTRCVMCSQPRHMHHYMSHPWEPHPKLTDPHPATE